MEILSNVIYKNLCKLLSNYQSLLYGFSDIPEGQFCKQYNSAIVLAVPHEKMINLNDYSEEGFENNIRISRERIHTIVNNITELLLQEKINYYVPPTAQTSEKTLFAPFSFKYAAVRAGLGWIGKNDVLITKEYGPRVGLSAILVDYEFPKGMPVSQSKCSDDCFLCKTACPHNCIAGTQWNITQHRNKLIDYQLCNSKRSEFLKTHNRKNACGLCMVACPFGL